MKRFPSWLLYLVCLASGFSGLVYQVCWERILKLSMGVDVLSASTIVGVFLLGLGLGALLVGRWADRTVHVLRLYAILEFVIGLYGLVSIRFLDLFQDFSSGLQSHLDLEASSVPVALLVPAFLLLLLPTACMGGTLPILIRAASHRFERMGRNAGWIYAVNTLGAVGGAFGGGFLLVGSLGLDGAVAVAAGVNLLLGAVTLAFGWRTSVEPATVPSPPPPTRNRAAPGIRFFLVLYGVSGLIALGYEILWIRMLGIALASSTYIFSTVVAVFLLATAAGAAFMGPLADRTRNVYRLLSTLQLLIAGSAVASTLLFILFFRSMPISFTTVALTLKYEIPRIGTDVSALTALKHLIQAAFYPFLVIFPPVFLMGGMFPVLNKIVQLSAEDVAKRTGQLYWANILGCISGCLVAGFLLLPLLGMFGTLAVLTFGSFALWVTLEILYRRRSMGRPVHPAVQIGAGAVLVAGLGLAGSRFYETVLPAASEVNGMTLERYSEGLTGVCSVGRAPDETRSLYINGDLQTVYGTFNRHRLMGHVIALSHPRPRRILGIGLGGGMTPAEILKYDSVERIVLVEISHELAEILPHYASYHGLTEDPRVRLRFEDGRNFLLRSGKRYDVVYTSGIRILEAGSGFLTSEEYYRLLRDRLDEGGICVVQMSGWFREAQERLLATFARVFPEFLVFSGTVIAGRDGLRFNLESLRERMERHRGTLSELPLLTPELVGSGGEPFALRSPREFLRLFTHDAKSFPDLAGLPTNRDLYPRTEYWLSIPGVPLRYTYYRGTRDAPPAPRRERPEILDYVDGGTPGEREELRRYLAGHE